MKLIESKAEYIPQEEGLEGIYKQIELAGRTAYHSSPKYRYWTSDGKNFINGGTEDFKLLYNPEEYPIKQNISAENFVDRMIKSKHGACLEHGTVYLAIPYTDGETLSHYRGVAGKYNEIEFTKYSKVTMMRGTHNYVTSNYRVLIENNWLDDLQYLCSPTEYHEKRYTMRFTCSRAIAQELTRQRTYSFLMESQRYINYSKERHGGDITFIKPSWLNCTYEDIPPQSELCYLAKQHPDEAAHRFIASLVESKYAYMTLLQKGCTPQQARDVLPNATKTELIMTGFSSDWKHIMDLRLFGKTGAPHPDMIDLMGKAAKVMQEAGIWEDIMSKPSKFD